MEWRILMIQRIEQSNDESEDATLATAENADAFNTWRSFLEATTVCESEDGHQPDGLKTADFVLVGLKNGFTVQLIYS
ncbi:MAG TPA: hypothetical protein VGH19_07225 [Verrucomicrobiae bacterium]